MRKVWLLLGLLASTSAYAAEADLFVQNSSGQWVPASTSVPIPATANATATAAVPSYTNAAPAALSQTLSGGLRVQLHMGATDLSLGSAASASALPVVIASDQATFPTNAQASATTAVPSYTNATQNALSQTLSGGLRVQLHIGSTDLSLGSVASASSIPVVIANDQSAIAVTPGQAPGTPPVASTALEASHVLKASPVILYFVYASSLTGGTAGFLQIFNATSAPGDGAVTPLICVPFVNNYASISFAGMLGATFLTGATAVVSSATSCFTKTTGSLTAFISAITS